MAETLISTVAIRSLLEGRFDTVGDNVTDTLGELPVSLGARLGFSVSKHN